MRNYSKQREEIIGDLIALSSEYPTAEEIYLSVKKRDSSISKTTVYRNITMLLEEDVIMRIPNVNGADRYTLVTEDNRNFMICSSCGKVVEFNHDFNIKGLKKTLNQKYKFELLSKSISVLGLCDECSKENGGK
jgi:Fur family ferric uptake transcriptional regulator